MLRSLIVLAFALAPAAFVPGCTATTPELELKRPLVLTPVDDPRGALQRVVAAVRADPQAGLDVGEVPLVGDGQGPAVHETFVTGPEKHVLEDYIRTHPELAPPAGHAFGYERLRDDGRTYWRMHCVEAGGLALRKLGSALLSQDAEGRQRIRVRLLSEDVGRLASLTAAQVGRRLAVVQDDEVLMAPVMREPLTGGELEITLGAVTTSAEARVMLDHLLGR
ncbi:SecDF P1 head subdomain-containing protein [Nannocystis bainbridge]|uniref:SecDF P1 head subdomain domain-containing protein n=1 Tax=Nannocystis bainbridge TaxID=2995303 RepID=A0ABT5E9V2_9BACT|nr:hypothetical protein [Nannocystis bainbridge]MDC0722139.1 hypothetical protein [Nannocystis bainbridge]